METAIILSIFFSLSLGKIRCFANNYLLYKIYESDSAFEFVLLRVYVSFMHENRQMCIALLHRGVVDCLSTALHHA